MREAAVESHPFGFPLGFARGFGKTGQALFAKCAKKDGAPRRGTHSSQRTRRVGHGE